MSTFESFGYDKTLSFPNYDLTFLQKQYPELSIEYHSAITTTLSLIDRASACEQLVLTEYQSHGRGRGAHKSWQSFYGRQILMSYGPFLSGVDINQYDALVYEAVLLVLHRYNPLCRFKPPNDIYIGSLKISGALLEVGTHGSFLHLGVNILDSQNAQYSYLLDRTDKWNLQTAVEGKMRESIIVDLIECLRDLDIKNIDRSTGFLRRNMVQK